jgi:hypothetical protein
LKKEEFMKKIAECNLPENIDQKLLDEAAPMMKKWGEGYEHEGVDKEYLFKHFGLEDKPEDGDMVRKEKAALRCVASKIFKTELKKSDAEEIMRNLNKINKPGFRWLG